MHLPNQYVFTLPQAESPTTTVHRSFVEARASQPKHLVAVLGFMFLQLTRGHCQSAVGFCLRSSSSSRLRFPLAASVARTASIAYKNDLCGSSETTKESAVNSKPSPCAKVAVSAAETAANSWGISCSGMGQDQKRVFLRYHET